MSRTSGGPNPCGGSRAAAAPDADVVTVTVEPGPAFIARLRDVLRNALDAPRFVIQTNAGAIDLPPLGEGRVGADVTVVAVPVTDTCKEVVDGRVRRTIPRDTLVDARGPWTLSREALTQALDRVGSGAEISNLIELCRTARLRVRVLISQ